MDYFNSTFKGKLPAIKSIDAKRKKAIKARVAQYGKQAVFDVFQLVLDSPFLLGQNDKNWRCTFDWIFKSANFTKILEEITMENELILRPQEENRLAVLRTSPKTIAKLYAPRRLKMYFKVMNLLLALL